MTCICEDCKTPFSVCGRGRKRCHVCRLRVRREQWRRAKQAKRSPAIEAAIERHLAAIRLARRRVA